MRFQKSSAILFSKYDFNLLPDHNLQHLNQSRTACSKRMNHHSPALNASLINYPPKTYKF
ncbi:hypothetical protein Hanom_Chr02g00111661 [Helianthus anomalus]